MTGYIESPRVERRRRLQLGNAVLGRLGKASVQAILILDSNDPIADLRSPNTRAQEEQGGLGDERSVWHFLTTFV